MATVEAPTRPQIRLHEGPFVNEPLVDFTREENARKMRAAIENFARLPTDGAGKILVLGAMAELGSESVNEHKSIIDLIGQYPWAQVVLVGGDFLKVQHPYRSFTTSVEAADWYRHARIKNSWLLIKGSRSSKMEAVLE